MLTTLPVAEAVARACGTHHHLTRTFAQVCRAWRDAAHEEACNRLDAALECVRQRYMRRCLLKQRYPVRIGHLRCQCNYCDVGLNFQERWWHAIDDPTRAFHLCSTCYTSYDGPYRFVDIARGDENDPPYFVNAIKPLCSGRPYTFVVAPMQVPQRLRWPRTLHSVDSAQLLRAAEEMYEGNIYGLVTFTTISTFDRHPIWIDLVTDKLRIRHKCESAYHFDESYSRLLFNTPVRELERDGSFNVLDWIPVAVSLRRQFNSDGNLLQHVVCANPSNTRFYGCRAVIVERAWRMWSDNNLAELKRTCFTTLNEAGWNAGPHEAERRMEKRIRKRAYEIWQATQRNDDMANWLQAQREIYDGVEDSSLAAP